MGGSLLSIPPLPPGLAAPKGGAADLVKRFSEVAEKSAAEVAGMNDFAIAEGSDFHDAA